MKQLRALSILFSVAGLAVTGTSQLRIATWNVTNYSGGRVNEFQTAIYGQFNGRSMAPDLLIGQEFISQTAVNTFRDLLNTASGSPGDWAAAPFIDGPDTDSAFFYRTSKVIYIATTIAARGSTDPNNQPRNTYRYDFRPVGYSGDGSIVACYSVHMKAGSQTTDQSRRLVEAQRIRANAETLDSSWNFLMAGDTNIQTSSQAAYQELVGSHTLNSGRFFDPIDAPGSWNNNGSFRFVHTQDPASQMDDRFDQIILSANLINHVGMDYIGNSTATYSESTWNDPNHSFRCWGNDGTSFNTLLTVNGNTMVGPTIAQALIDSALGNGHFTRVFGYESAGTRGVSAIHRLRHGVSRHSRPQSPRGLECGRHWIMEYGRDCRLELFFLRLFRLFRSGRFISGSAWVAAESTRYPDGHDHTWGKTGTVIIHSDDPDQPSRVVTLRGYVFGRSPISGSGID